MEMNFIGFAAALATFFGVWLGHVSVRKIERETVNLWKPALIAIALGTGLEIAALLTSSLISVCDEQYPRCDLALGCA